ncbi:hypothetical protein MASR1M50_01060 [Burkholderiales bacterium]
MTDLYQSITERIIRALEIRRHPWRFPISVEAGIGRAPKAPASRHRRACIAGINARCLAQYDRHAHEGYRRNRWLTYQQARMLGAHVRRGENGHTHRLLQDAGS